VTNRDMSLTDALPRKVPLFPICAVRTRSRHAAGRAMSESKKNELRRRLLDGTGDFNNDGTPDILQHQINHNDGSMTLRALQMNPNAVQVQSAPCFQFARLLRSRPSGVRGPVLLPP
jgi:hypothetical protein